MPKIYTEENSKEIRKGFLTITAVENPDDKRFPYEVINKVDAVVIAVLTHDLKEIYVTKQWRPCNNQMKIEVVAGLLDVETLGHYETALKEIEEEIRISRNDISAMYFTGSGYSSSGCLSEKVYRYIAVLKEGAVEDDTLPKASDTDIIQRFKLPVQEAFKLFTSNTGQLLAKEIVEMFPLSFPKRKIGVMGGTFSPFTNQHLRNIMRAVEMFNLDEVIIAPSSEKYSKPKLSYDTRRKTIELGLNELTPEMRKKVSISDLERYEIRTTTYETMCKILTKQPEPVQLYAIFGTDNMYDLGRGWEKGQELLDEFEIIAIERDQFKMNDIYMNSECQLLVPYAHRIHQIPPITHNTISSSIVRRMVAQGLDVSTLVSREVRDFLNTEQVKAELVKAYKK